MNFHHSLSLLLLILSSATETTDAMIGECYSRCGMVKKKKKAVKKGPTTRMLANGQTVEEYENEYEYEYYDEEERGLQETSAAAADDEWEWATACRGRLLTFKGKTQTTRNQCLSKKCGRCWVNPFGTDVCIDENEPCGGAGGGNDPHFKDWGGEWYDYHGACDMVLVHVPNFVDNEFDLDIHIRTKQRYDYSYIETAAIQIGNDVLQVTGSGDYYFNGVGGMSSGSVPEMGLLGGLHWEHQQLNKKSHVFDIHLDNDEHITIKTFKDWVTIKIDSDSEDVFGESVGLLGNFYDGSRYGRDGTTTIVDPNDFAQEWQVRDTDPSLFMTQEHPQWPAKCIPPPTSSKTARRLGEQTNAVSTEAAKTACSKVCGDVVDAHCVDACVYDVMASGDLEVAQMATGLL